MAQFRTKARAIELLGKGQIADLPTAISELWKNGYDAYATELSCTLYSQGYGDIKNYIFTLSDNGFGMDEKDILEKWIVLGTDSKARGVSFFTDKQRFGLPARTPMGEKGIGRLSVAFLGSPMLMLTKKEDKPLQILFIDWRILENYNLYVEDVNIPLESCRSVTEFIPLFMNMQEEFLELVEFEGDKNSEFKKHKQAIWRDQETLRLAIRSSVKAINISQTIIEEVIKPFMEDSFHGTTFLIFEPNEQLLELDSSIINDEVETDNVSEIQRSLSGIFNKFDRNALQDFTTQFLIKKDTGCSNIINDFYEAADFEKVDHHISGTFDENGFFNGTVRVFKEITKFQYKPVRKPGKTPYGPMRIDIGCLEGDFKNSMLEEEEFNRYKKINSKYGAVYVYRDQFRVLPYGRPDYDFLKFEERRTKKAGMGFFSHRNMFGYIGISRITNSSLIDKAGREGFVENKAYKEFKQDLIAFFIELTKTYFKSQSEGEEDNARSRQVIINQARYKRVLEEEKKKNKQTKVKFNNDVKQYQAELALLTADVKHLQQELKEKAEQVSWSYEQYCEVSNRLGERKTKLRSLRLSRPNRISLTARQEEKFDNYRRDYEYVAEIVCSCQESVNEIRQQFDVQNLKKDFELRYASILKDIANWVIAYRKRFDMMAQSINEKFKDEQRFFVEQFKNTLQDSVSEPVTREDYQKAINTLQTLAESFKDAIDARLEAFVSHAESLNFEIDDDVLIKWYKDEQEKLEKKLEATEELAQLGISVEIIDHELNSLYAQMSSSMVHLGIYARQHAEVISLYNQMHVAFEHMEANYKMLKPLYHNKRRMKTTFSGEMVYNDMKSFFMSKIDGLNVLFEADQNFLTHEFHTYQSIIESVFINVINNALYWLIPVSDRKIRIEYIPSTREILIMNNGEKMADATLEDIFALFYTKKREGRGIGLYLCRKSLRAEGFDIIASNAKEYNKLDGACFIIKPLTL